MTASFFDVEGKENTALAGALGPAGVRHVALATTDRAAAALRLTSPQSGRIIGQGLEGDEILL
jgi:hypothetical protein